MSTNVYRVSLTAASLSTPTVAPAPSGGTYFASVSGAGADTVHLARIDSAGAITWQKELTFDGADTLTASVLSSSTHVCLIVRYLDPDTITSTTAVLLYAADGTLAWHQAYELQADPQFLSSFVMDPADQAVYIVGSVASAETMLLKLSGTTGSPVWSVNLQISGESSAVAAHGPIVLLSGGDLIAYVRGPIHSDGSARGYLQRCSKTDGSVSWTRAIAWPLSGGSTMGLAVDASDNIYAYGPQFFNPTYAQLPVVKFDAAGTTLWNRQLATPAGLQARDLRFTWGARGFAGTDGLLLPNAYTQDDVSGFHRGGFASIAASGTVGTANAPLVTFNSVTSALLNVRTYGGTGQQLLGAFVDTVSSYAVAVVFVGGVSSAEDSSFGPYTRTTFAFDTEAGLALVSSASLTRAASVSIPAATARTVAEGGTPLSTTTYTATAPTQTGNATGIAPTVQFGVPLVVGVVTSAAATTAFGSTTHLRGQPASAAPAATAFGAASVLFKFFATGTAPSALFGLPAVNLNLQYEAGSIPAVTEFGEVWAVVSIPPRPHNASGIAFRTSFGAATAAAVFGGSAAGSSTTAFGLPRCGQGVGAAGASSAVVFGTARLNTPVRVEGASLTQFGVPRLGHAVNLTGRASGVVFGSFAASFASRVPTTGACGTSFGTPALVASKQRVRSGWFRTRFGSAQSERTAP